MYTKHTWPYSIVLSAGGQVVVAVVVQVVLGAAAILKQFIYTTRQRI